MRQRCHPPVERERLQPRPRIVIGDQPVKKSRPAGGLEDVQHGPPVLRNNEAACESVDESGTRLPVSCVVVMGQSDVRFADNLV